MVLKHIASKIKERCRKTDIIARYGGEEIGILLPNADEKEACGVAEKIRHFFENDTFVIDDKIKIRVTVSLGLVDAAPEELKEIEDYNLIIRLADDALYQAKKKGRNRTEVARLADIF
jgi:diguanylate cyclase (GGDEF)-like protein